MHKKGSLFPNGFQGNLRAVLAVELLRFDKFKGGLYRAY